MMNNHLNVFRITAFLVNTAGEESNIETVTFDNHDGDVALNNKISKYVESRMCLDHLDRMKIELENLREKHIKLLTFLNSETTNPKFTDENQRNLLKFQYETMESYISILEARIKYDSEK